MTTNTCALTISLTPKDGFMVYAVACATCGYTSKTQYRSDLFAILSQTGAVAQVRCLSATIDSICEDLPDTLGAPARRDEAVVVRGKAA